MWKGLSNRPMKGCLDPKVARKRRQACLEGSPTRANGLKAELKSRLLLKSRARRRKGLVLMDRDRSVDSKELFGVR